MVTNAKTTLTISVRLIENAVRQFKQIGLSVNRLRLGFKRSESASVSLIRSLRKITSVLVLYFIFRRVIIDITRSFTALIKKAADFQEGLLGIQRLSKITSAGLRGISDDLTTLSIKFGATTDSLTEVGQVAARAGFRGREQISGLTEVLTQFGKVTGVITGPELDKFIRIGRLFGLESAEQFRRLGDVLAKLETVIPGTAAEILELTRFLGAGRATNKLALQDALALSATFVELGQKFRTTGFQVFKFYSALGDPSKVAIFKDFIGKTLGEQGITTFEGFGDSAEDATAVLELFIQVLAKLGTGERTQFLELLKVAGTRFGLTFGALAAGAEKFEKNLRVAREEASKGGELALQFDIRMRGLNAQWSRFIESINKLKRALITPLLDGMAGRIKSIADSVAEIDNKQLIERFAFAWERVFEILGKVSTKIGELMPLIKRLGALVLKIGIAVLILKVSFLAAVGIFSLWIGAIITITALFTPLGAALVAINIGIGLILLDLTALIAAIIFIGPKWKEIFIDMARITLAFANDTAIALDGVVNAFRLTVLSLLRVLRPLVNVGAGIFGDKAQALARLVSGATIKGLEVPIKIKGDPDAANKALDKLGEILQKVPFTTILKEVFGNIPAEFETFFNELTANWVEVFKGLAEKMGLTLEEVMTKFFPEGFLEGILGGGVGGGGPGEGFPGGGGPEIPDDLAETTDLVNQMTSAIDGMAESVFNFISGAADARTSLDSLIGNIRDFVKQRFVKAFTDALKEKLNPVFLVLDKFAQQLANTLVSLFDPIISIVASLAKKLIGAILNTLLPGLGSIFSFHQGTTFVPQTGLAVLQKGEQVIPAQFNQGGGFGGGTSMVFNFNGPIDNAEETSARIAEDVEQVLLRSQRAVHGRQRGPLNFIRT